MGNSKRNPKGYKTKVLVEKKLYIQFIKYEEVEEMTIFNFLYN